MLIQIPYLVLLLHFFGIVSGVGKFEGLKPIVYQNKNILFMKNNSL